MNTNRLFAGLLAAVISAGALAAGAGAESVPMEIIAERYATEQSFPITVGDLKFYQAAIFRDGDYEHDGTLDVGCAYGSIERYDPRIDEVREVVIPSEVNGMKVSEIGFKAFMSCKNMKTITIPDTVVRISSTAFEGCDSLTDIYYAGSEADWNNITWTATGYNPQPINSYINNATVHFNSGSDKEADSAKPSKVSSFKKSATKSTIKLTWNKNDDADAYVVKYSTDKKTWKTKTVKTNSVTLKKLKSGTKYYFRVAAKKDGATGEFSKIFGVTTKK